MRKLPQPYEYREINSIKEPIEIGLNLFCTKKNYSFKAIKKSNSISKNRPKPYVRYIVEIEEYSYSVCAIKFYRACDVSKGSTEKYRVKTNDCIPYRILSTVLCIGLDYLRDNPYTSFVFYGINDKDESNVKSKRYRIYVQLLHNYIGIQTFERYKYEKHSYMLLLNKINPMPDLLLKIEELFKKGYHI